MAVQSVVAHNDLLYVLDTRNPLFGGVVDPPRIFVFDLSSNALQRIYTLSTNSYHSDSYVNDLRIDNKTNRAYFTDSGHPGLIVLDLQTGESQRVLNEHPSAAAETDRLTIDGEVWKNTVHSDGIALDTKNDMLYYHALTGYALYRIPTAVLWNADPSETEKAVEYVAQTPAPDGMIFDDQGRLFLADLENHRVVYLNTNNGKISTLVEGENVRWADTFTIYESDLYYTNSRIHETGEDIDALNFTIYKVALP